MVKNPPLELVFLRTIRSVYSAEIQLARLVPQVMRRITDEDLRPVVESIGTLARQHLARLELVSKRHDLPLTERGATGMTGIIEEMTDALDAAADGTLCDLAVVILIGKALRYRRAGYLSALALAGGLGWRHAAATMEAILEDEEGLAATLTAWTHSTLHSQTWK